MKFLFNIVCGCLALAIHARSEESRPSTLAKKVQVYILAGQSNMEGHGQLNSLDWLGHHPQYGDLLKRLKAPDGSWAVREDVSITWTTDFKDKQSGPLTVGWGCSSNEVGPELMFGTVVGDAHEVPVLLIKTAWGGKDVYCDFRPPSAGAPTGDAAVLLERERAEGNVREPGAYYQKMLSEIRAALSHISDLVPGYSDYDLAGMAWFQGWNDFCRWHDAPGVLDEYPRTLARLFHDLRVELNAPTLPIAIGEMGVGGGKIVEYAESRPDAQEAQAIVKFRAAQRAVAEDPSLSNVIFVPTAPYWDDRLQELREMSDAYWAEKQKQGIPDTEENHLPSKELNDEYLRLGNHWYCHYNGSASNYSLIGYALAEALLSASTPGARFDPVVKEIEGWKVSIDPTMLEGEHREEGTQALQMLANHLQRIRILVPKPALMKLQTIEIWIEHEHPALGAMQYHPSIDWLIANGHDPRLARKVHITRARELLSRDQMLKHPAVILHELAHGYHDQILGFDHPGILAAYERARDAGIYENVLLYTGARVRHYALTDHKEYFAEGTEAYFYRNDFYPFVRAELNEHDPALAKVLAEVWDGGEAP